MSNSEISPLIAIGRQQVGLWRHRWQQSYEALLMVELNETRAELCRTIENVLSDAPRRGEGENKETALAIQAKYADVRSRGVILTGFGSS
ncbi:MAG: hypothetical protein R3C05_26265 [Pirellulaceae bacterium]